MVDVSACGIFPRLRKITAAPSEAAMLTRSTTSHAAKRLACCFSVGRHVEPCGAAALPSFKASLVGLKEMVDVCRF